MKKNIINPLLLPALIAVLNLIPAGRVTAQTFTTLHSFSAPDLYTGTNNDGIHPDGSLIVSGNNLYGTTIGGGGSANGTVFAVHTDGTGFTNLHSFSAASHNSSGVLTNSDGVRPFASLVLSGNNLYGTARDGGSSGGGTVFRLNTDGTGFTKLHVFTARSGPFAGTNSDGASPYGKLILSASTLYGTASGGGSSGYGTVFAIHPNGMGFTNLHSFTGASDGAYPEAGLITNSSGTTLYGTAPQGGSSGYGTVFAINTDGTGFTNLHNFPARADNGNGYGTNSDGVLPYAGLVLSGNILYGTANGGGSWGAGTVFAINTDGTGFTNLYSFNGGSDGSEPLGGVILSGDTLYGTTYYGGGSGNGTVFSLSFRPQLTIAPSGTNVILSWPISYAGFSYAGYYLEETANLSSPTSWISVVDTNLPVIVNGQLRITRPMLGPQWSYRLRKQ